MQNEPNEIDILIARMLASEATAEEVSRVEAWRRADPANEAAYGKSLSVFEVLQDDAFRPDVEAAWRKLDSRIGGEGARVIPLGSPRRMFWAAAAIVLVLGIALLMRSLAVNETEQTIAATSAPVEKSLPDGSKVLLNRNSELKYTKGRSGKRQAILQGEAFFEVVHNDDEPFVVQAGEVFVKDIGTEFYVRALAGSSLTEIYVQSGEVELYTEVNPGMRLTRGEAATYDKTAGKFIKKEDVAATNITSFRTKAFTFREALLGDVIDEVNNVYGSHIRLQEPGLRNCRLSVTFIDEPLDVVLDIIRETLDLESRRSGDTLILYGNECDR